MFILWRCNVHAGHVAFSLNALGEGPRIPAKIFYSHTGGTEPLCICARIGGSRKSSEHLTAISSLG